MSEDSSGREAAHNAAIWTWSCVDDLARISKAIAHAQLDLYRAADRSPQHLASVNRDLDEAWKAATDGLLVNIGRAREEVVRAREAPAERS